MARVPVGRHLADRFCPVASRLFLGYPAGMDLLVAGGHPA